MNMNHVKALSLAAAGGFILLAVSCSGCTLPLLEGGSTESVTILSYNVENLFDDVTNGSEYYQYDPSRGEWTTELFHRKLAAISEVILSSPRGGADVLALQEVENINAAETLRDHYLKGGGYRHMQITETPDSAIQLLCMSRYPIVSARSHRTSIYDIPLTRAVLEVTLDIDGVPCTLLLNHWKSKYGGAEETEPSRMASAALIRRRTAEIAAKFPERDIVVAGDLNVRADEYEFIDREYPTALMPLSEAPAFPGEQPYEDASSLKGEPLFLTGSPKKVGEGAEGSAVFYSPWLGEETDPPGSYVYGGEWEQIDHYLLGENLFDGRGLDYDGFSVEAPDFILGKDGYPYSFYRAGGTGYSDHLPILLKLEIMER
ncbi:MAG: endonuclease/exonuclease/phosphatase family protein [Spirochaetaceae bacterium]